MVKNQRTSSSASKTFLERLVQGLAYCPDSSSSAGRQIGPSGWGAVFTLRRSRRAGLVKPLAVAGSDRTVEPIQPAVRDWGLTNILPPPRSIPPVRRER